MGNLRTQNTDKLDDEQLYPVSVSKSQELEKIKGKTLEVYYLMVRNPDVKYGVREIQRTLGYSSSSIAAYHLDRLVEYNLIQKTPTGQYYIDKDPILLGKLEDHVKIAGNLIPKIAIYSYQAFITILASIILFIISARPMVWFIYLISSNLIFLAFLFRDSKVITSKLEVEKNH